jgi:hypothetical protein
MGSENAAKKHGKTEWWKHLRSFGKRASAKLIRQLRKKPIDKKDEE